MKYISLENLTLFYTKLKTIFALKTHTHTSTDVTQTSSARFVTDTEKTTWNAKSNFSGSYTDLTNKPTLFSGSYTDLTNKPTIPSVETVTEAEINAIFV